MFAFILVILLAHGAGAAEYAEGTVSPWAGEIVPMGIELHNKTMVTYPGTPDPPLDCFKKTINFHDFTRRLVALNPVGKKTYYIKASGETYDEMKTVVSRIKRGDTAPRMQATEEWDFPKTPVPTGEVARRVGKRIANFCSGCKVYILQDGKVTRATADDTPSNMPRLTKRGGGCFLCFKCIITASWRSLQ